MGKVVTITQQAISGRMNTARSHTHAGAESTAACLLARASTICMLLMACVVSATTASLSAATSSSTESSGTGAPSVVKISLHNNHWSLTVNNSPFEIKGAGIGRGDANSIASLAAAGGNAFRTWDTRNLGARLDAAQAHGLMVLVGLNVQKELQGFDYNDEAAVASQHAGVTAVIDKYKDHPALLGWIVANEPNLLVDNDGQLIPANPQVYDALNDIVRYIHAQDTAHPATITFAFTPTVNADITTALARIPKLDFVSLQAYGALPVLPDLVAELELNRPYMITEYGPLGHWEMPATTWGREIEEPSGSKARGMIDRLNAALEKDTDGRLIGTFAFLWGQKQERTPTWYGMFIASGERTATVDELTHHWTGKYPENRAPSAWDIAIDTAKPTDNIRLRPEQRSVASVDVQDQESDQLEARWELMKEVDTRSQGGHFEAKPDSVSFAFEPMVDDSTTISWVAPTEPGEYRLYAYVFDGHGGVATANIPFLVKRKEY